MRRAIVAVAFAVISLSVCAPLHAQETHPGGTWGAWLTLPQYPKLNMRVKCEYWVTDKNDNNRAHSLWAIQYRSEYARPMDVVQANTYYDTVLKANKNWNAPGQFTLQPGQTADYGETSVLGACPKSGGSSPINLAVYCVVPSGQADQSPHCQAHGVPKVKEPGSAIDSGSSSSAGASGAQSSSNNASQQNTSNTQPQKANPTLYWYCQAYYFPPYFPPQFTAERHFLFNQVWESSKYTISDSMSLGQQFTNWVQQTYSVTIRPPMSVSCWSFELADQAQTTRQNAIGRMRQASGDPDHYHGEETKWSPQ